MEGNGGVQHSGCGVIGEGVRQTEALDKAPPQHKSLPRKWKRNEVSKVWEPLLAEEGSGTNQDSSLSASSMQGLRRLEPFNKDVKQETSSSGSRDCMSLEKLYEEIDRDPYDYDPYASKDAFETASQRNRKATNYYDVGGIEVIDYIKAKLTPEQYRGYLLGNIYKYSGRCQYKGEYEKDIVKLQEYTDWLLAC